MSLCYNEVTHLTYVKSRRLALLFASKENGVGVTAHDGHQNQVELSNPPIPVRKAVTDSFIELLQIQRLKGAEICHSFIDFFVVH